MKWYFVIALALTFLDKFQARPSDGVESRATEIDRIPYYGGAKGQVLQIIKNDDGSITNTIIKSEDSKKLQNSDGSFEHNLQNIQLAASRLVAIQESAKKRGTFSAADNKIYADNLYQLGVAAQQLAQTQNQGDNTDFRKLFESTYGSRRPIQTAADRLELTKFPEELGDSVSEQDEVISQHDSDTVEVNAPNRDAPVAEAKPIGLSIAGEGGVASSKPVATAIAGPNGLAIARPVATAIAGIAPSEVSSLGIPVGNRIRSTAVRLVKKIPEEKYRLTEDGRLSGPIEHSTERPPTKKEMEENLEIQESTPRPPTDDSDIINSNVNNKEQGAPLLSNFKSFAVLPNYGPGSPNIQPQISNIPQLYFY